VPGLRNNRSMTLTLRITPPQDQAREDRRYWLTRTPEERIAAVELLRRKYWDISDANAEPALERVCRMVRLHRR
jgi:hypothetical protein